VLQITKLHDSIDALQVKHGSKKLSAIYGAGCITAPELMLVFMNPTGKNVSAQVGWKGLRAPWLGTKNVWKILYKLSLIPEYLYEQTQALNAADWTPDFAIRLYEGVAKRKIYITNLAKCTQDDARHVPDAVFRQYLPVMQKEILAVNPKRIITFGNQVSSLLLQEAITASNYVGLKKELLQIGKVSHDVYPVYYPVGQGQRNTPLAVKRLQAIMQTI
jgi:DNA polymerase